MASTRGDRLRQLTVRDVALGLQALLCLPLAAAGLRRWGLQNIQGYLAGRLHRPAETVERAETVDASRRLAWLVNVVASRGPVGANCLQRSLVLWWFLLRRGLEAEIRIGVRRRPGTASGAKGLDFHAWVELEGVVLNDRADVRRRFVTFDRAIAPTNVRWR